MDKNSQAQKLLSCYLPKYKVVLESAEPN